MRTGLRTRSREAGWRLGIAARVVPYLLLALAGCGGVKERPRADAMAKDAAARADAETPTRDAAAADAGVTGARDSGLGADDAGRAEGVRDAATRDASGAPSLRARVCGDASTWPAPLPAADQRRAQPVGTRTFGFVEGPVWLAEPEFLLFSDMDFSAGDAQGPPARIWRLTPPATFDLFVPSSNSNGLALTPDGTVLAATHDNQALSLFSPADGARSPVAVSAAEKRLNSPNDLTVRSDGTTYLTDPDWQLGPRSSETGVTGVYRIAPPLAQSGVNDALLVEGGLDKPNGIALSPDERTLYVGSSGNEIWKYELAADGSVSDPIKFAETGASDGMAVDCAGNLYVTSGTVEVLAPDGSRLGEIAVAESPTNAAFGGAERKTLYITAGTRLYAIALNVPGFPY